MPDVAVLEDAAGRRSRLAVLLRPGARDSEGITRVDELRPALVGAIEGVLPSLALVAAHRAAVPVVAHSARVAGELLDGDVGPGEGGAPAGPVPVREPARRAVAELHPAAAHGVHQRGGAQQSLGGRIRRIVGVGAAAEDHPVVSDDDEPFGVVHRVADAVPDLLERLGAAELAGGAAHPLALRCGIAPDEAAGGGHGGGNGRGRCRRRLGRGLGAGTAEGHHRERGEGERAGSPHGTSGFRGAHAGLGLSRNYHVKMTIPTGQERGPGR